MKQALDEYFMKQALKEAVYAYEKNELPVGAIIVFHKTIIAHAHNLTKQLKDATAHAELQVISTAELYFKGKFNSLKECSLYVSLEPCIMCAGAILWANLGRLVFGALNHKRFYSKKKNIIQNKTIIHKEILPKESSLLLESFFKKKRKLYYTNR